MIINSKPISMAEAKEYLNEDSAEIYSFIEKFVQSDAEQAKAIAEKIKALDLLKVKDYHISKIIDILPEDKEDLNKIFSDIGLDEDETTKLLDTIKEFK